MKNVTRQVVQIALDQDAGTSYAVALLVLIVSHNLRKFLLDEERPQITQLPRARDSQHRQLDQRPPHHPAINALALISKLRLPLPLEYLLPPDILQPCVDILDLLQHLAYLVLVCTLDL